MPVSNISTFVDWSSKAGAGRWIGYVLVVFSAGPLSTGSPTMLRMRPSVSLPTGMEIGAPVSLTIIPRVRPSVEAMAMARTWLSPRCWATSSVSLEEYAKTSFCSTPCTMSAL